MGGRVERSGDNQKLITEKGTETKCASVKLS